MNATIPAAGTKVITPSDAREVNHDPVCGMVVSPTGTTNRVDHDGRTFYFCCAGCKAKFLVAPPRYLTPVANPASGAQPAPEAPAVTANAAVIYTCPMHPKVRQKTPGSCPLCGMALEPEGVPAATGANPELKDMTRRFVIGATLATPIVVLEM